MPSSSSFTQCACQTRSPTQPVPSAYCAGVQPNFSREYATSRSLSARWVCMPASYAAASAADSRMRSRDTVNGEQGAAATRVIA
jgi:hypothetical protein